MSEFENLSDDEKARVEAKVDELCHRTGRSWAYSITKAPGQATKTFPEIIIDGKIAQPVELPDEPHSCVEILCEELDKHAKDKF